MPFPLYRMVVVALSPREALFDSGARAVAGRLDHEQLHPAL